METLSHPDPTDPTMLRAMTELWGPWRAMSSLVSSNQQESNMQRAVPNRATMRVADTTEVSGRVTADEVNLDGFHNRIRKACALGRTWLALVTASMGLYLVLPDRGLAQNENDQGNDPIVGSWISHATLNSTPPQKVESLQSFWRGGIVVSTEAIGTAYGVWKRSGPPRTYEAKDITILPSGTINTVIAGPLVLNPQGTEITGPFHGFGTAPDGTVIYTFSGTVVTDRITFSSTP